MTPGEAHDILRVMTQRAVHAKPNKFVLNRDTYKKLHAHVLARSRGDAPEGVHIKRDAALKVAGIPIEFTLDVAKNEVREHHAFGVFTQPLPYHLNIAEGR